jgi:hypothetical protein
VFALTIIGSGGESAPGMPNFITITASSPATIYYTIDGSEPTLDNSYVYTQPVDISSTTSGIVTVYSFAITAGGDVSEMFAKSFVEESTDVEPIASLSSLFGDLVKSYNLENIPNAIDADGNDVAFQDDENEDYDIIIPDSQLVTVVTTPSSDTGAVDDDDWVTSSSPSDIFFNPKARVIYVDTDSDENAVDTTIYHMGSRADLVKYRGGQVLREPYPIISGSLVRRMYSFDTGNYAAYYYDNISNNWVIMERKLLNGEFSLDRFSTSTWRRRGSGIGIVFQWLFPGRGNRF